MTRKYHLTFDIDWAPDESIEICLNMHAEYRAKPIDLDYDFYAVDGQILERRKSSFIVSSQNHAIEVLECSYGGDAA